MHPATKKPTDNYSSEVSSDVMYFDATDKTISTSIS